MIETPTDIHRHTYTEREGGKERHIFKHTNTDTQRQTHRNRQRQTERECRQAITLEHSPMKPCDTNNRHLRMANERTVCPGGSTGKKWDSGTDCWAGLRGFSGGVKAFLCEK